MFSYTDVKTSALCEVKFVNLRTTRQATILFRVSLGEGKDSDLLTVDAIAAGTLAMMDRTAFKLSSIKI